jgi:hypothetical protein
MDPHELLIGCMHVARYYSLCATIKKGGFHAPDNRVPGLQHL